MEQNLFENENGNFVNPCYMKVGFSRTTLSSKHVKRKKKKSAWETI